MKWNEFDKIIRCHIKKYGEDPGYFDWASNPVWNKFYSVERLSISDAEEILKFLKDWKMGRVIGQKEKKYGKEELRLKIIEYAVNNKQSFLFLKDKSFIDLYS